MGDSHLRSEESTGEVFTFSSLLKVSESVIIIIIHLLGLAPAGYLTAPDNGP
jgi:hypothetical protein